MWQSERLCVIPEFSSLLAMHIKGGVGWLSVEPGVVNRACEKDHRCLFLKRREGARHQLVCTLRPSGMWSGPQFHPHSLTQGWRGKISHCQRKEACRTGGAQETKCFLLRCSKEVQRRAQTPPCAPWNSSDLRAN